MGNQVSPRGEQGGIRAFVVDDVPRMVRTICTILGMIPIVDVVGTAHSGEEAIVQCQRLHPDLILMDVQLPGINGFDTTAELLAVLPEAKVIMVTIHDNAETMAACFAHGAHGFVSKNEMSKCLPLEIDRLFPEVRLQRSATGKS